MVGLSPNCPQMPTSTKRANGTWQAKIRLANFPPESQVFDTKARAMAWGYAREAELKTQGTGVVKGSLKDAVDRYITDVCPEHKSGDNEAKRLKALCRVKGLLPTGKQLSEVTAVDLSRFRDIRMSEVSVATVRKEMTILRSVLESARRDWGMITENPISDVKKPPAPPHRKRLFSDDEIKGVLQALNYEGDLTTLQHQVAVALLLALETGMRAGEMVALEWSWINLKRSYLTLPETKNGDQRDVPLSIKAKALLSKLVGLDKVTVFTVTSGSLDALFRKAKNSKGYKNLHFHDSRANAITALSKKLEVLDLARMVGHRDIKNLMIYYRKSASDMAPQLD